MRGSMLGRKLCQGIRRKSTFSSGFRVERKTTVLKKYIEEEEEEEGEEEEGEESGEEEEENGWEEQQESPLYRGADLERGVPDKRGSVGGPRGDGEETRRAEEAVAREVRRRVESLVPRSFQLPEVPSPPDYKDLVKVVLLGAPAVGKTSIIQQFVWNDFCDTYYPTNRRHTYYPSVVINGRLYDLKISDLPPVSYFPVDSLYEWTDFRSYGLRSATAYVLVFDLSNATDTFRHIKCLREQMAGSRDMRNVPVVVVGNKHDRLHSPIGVLNPEGTSSHAPGSFLGVPCFAQPSGFGLQGMSLSLSTLSSQAGQTMAHMGPSRVNSLLVQQHQNNAKALAESRERRDIANIVQKHWRYEYVECSAKYNWRVVSVFKELMQAVDTMEGKGGVDCAEESSSAEPGEASDNSKGLVTNYHLQRHHGTSIVPDNFYPELQRNKCNIL